MPLFPAFARTNPWVIQKQKEDPSLVPPPNFGNPWIMQQQKQQEEQTNAAPPIVEALQSGGTARTNEPSRFVNPQQAQPGFADIFLQGLQGKANPLQSLILMQILGGGSLTGGTPPWASGNLAAMIAGLDPMILQALRGTLTRSNIGSFGRGS